MHCFQVQQQQQQQHTLSSSLGATSSNRRSYPQSIQTNNAGASGAAGTPPKMQARGAQPLVAAGFDRPVRIIYTHFYSNIFLIHSTHYRFSSRFQNSRTSESSPLGYADSPRSASVTHSEVGGRMNFVGFIS